MNDITKRSEVTSNVKFVVPDITRNAAFNQQSAVLAAASDIEKLFVTGATIADTSDNYDGTVKANAPD